MPETTAAALRDEARKVVTDHFRANHGALAMRLVPVNTLVVTESGSEYLQVLPDMWLGPERPEQGFTSGRYAATGSFLVTMVSAEHQTQERLVLVNYMDEDDDSMSVFMVTSPIKEVTFK